MKCQALEAYFSSWFRDTTAHFGYAPGGTCFTGLRTGSASSNRRRAQHGRKPQGDPASTRRRLLTSFVRARLGVRRLTAPYGLTP